MNLDALYQSKILKNVQGNSRKLLNNIAYFSVKELRYESMFGVEALKAEKKTNDEYQRQ